MYHIEWSISHSIFLVHIPSLYGVFLAWLPSAEDDSSLLRSSRETEEI